tara:strand:+ start:140 stop:529 length:390 start_codon:yes stop_codon:yes gene_type:complete
MPPEAAQKIEGHWVGKEKERYNFTLKLLEQKSTTRGYMVYRMTDKFGNFFIAFDGREEWEIEEKNIDSFGTPIDPDEGEIIKYILQNGDCFTCKATVNRHDIAQFKYGSPDSNHKQTVLNRIKLNKLIQ